MSSPQIFGPGLITQVANQVINTRSWCPLTNGKFAIYSWTSGLVVSNMTSDFDMVQLSMSY
jgi:hypothetical protein